MDLTSHTHRALDWSVITHALSVRARTIRGQQACLELGLSDTMEEIDALYRAVAEVEVLEIDGARIPFGGIRDLRNELGQTARGVVLTVEELQGVRDAMVGMARLQDWLEERQERGEALWQLLEPMQLDAQLLQILSRAFDERGELCSKAWTTLGTLRVRNRRLKEAVRSELDRVLRSPEMEGVLQDRYITEREGRLVIPVRSGAPRRGLGIVHGTSQSGETLFIEPALVVAQSNEIRENQSAIQREIRRILGELSSHVGREAENLERSLQAVTQVDLAVARASLGRAWEGTEPSRSQSGVVDLKQARHPVLVLRGIEVVPNDLSLGAAQPALILSGPNTGGKTVALKTLGLCALLLRAGIPLPVGEGSRMDLMIPVLADVGDIQTVEGDLSTFSGHLLVLEQILEQMQPGALILLDEIGMGTDPAQGAALAQAFLEAIVEGGARLVTTTHFATLRALAAVDPRFAIAAVEVDQGRPSYRLVRGIAGASHAFSVALGLDIPESVVARARSLMDQGSRQVSDLVEELEVRRVELDSLHEELKESQAALDAEGEALRRKEAALEDRRSGLAQELAEGFGRRLAAQEDELKKMIAAMQEDPGLRQAGALLARVRETRKEVSEEVEPAPPSQTWLPLPDNLALGDSVWVKSLHKMGTVASLASRARVEVQLGTVRMQLKRGDLAGARTKARSSSPTVRAGTLRVSPSAEAVRTDGNTLDLRGCRLDEAIARSERYCDRMLLAGHDSVFLLHGHGTGALKVGLREWARSSPHVHRHRPGAEDEGGDAFTVLYLGL